MFFEFIYDSYIYRVHNPIIPVNKINFIKKNSKKSFTKITKITKKKVGISIRNPKINSYIKKSFKYNTSPKLIRNHP